MASPDVREFFPQINGNLTHITWAHAVNSVALLNESLASSDIMMIEADVIWGTVTGNTTLLPVMGHPPNTTSDISLAKFLEDINTFNTNNTNNATRKGVKLDFKSTDVWVQSQAVIGEYALGNYPLWLNADILSGPVNSTTVPVEAASFFQHANVVNNTVLSIGWTTNYGGNITGNYTTEQINSMLTVIRENNVTKEITFPVRAGLAAESVEQMATLLNNVSGSTITLWSNEGDSVNVENLRNLISRVGVNNTFVDVPSALRNQLRLDNLVSSASTIQSAFVGVLVAALALFL